ncbi:quinone-dependent dihydroorotate dehydrogenase [Candidatus Berkelbacteria bacterium CG10_big_fil_rev_8_21_14_0_10_43_14]|uniref:Dihydroorotate dehydrogenase (quinone) n=1 Tax=Candidatus Berkelbacteria bacterium CG10_big_fil_rev_8_21_14_0_10_43_14 TaxID=1974515 RepID=A0A2M6R8G1_9BACT|nr:MAG: quinone-dependent dihydroorotate dehydrogenase [Candidatus Berkelbacteria bacterium CG10_big_fil_rev_8_21_14_0_10_43_14]
MQLIIGFLYRNILRRIFFLFDAEDVHDRMIHVGIFLGKHSVARFITSYIFRYSNTMLEQSINGITFTNPIGLAAGFDKNAQLTDIIPCVGFGFIEVGSITGRPCVGNPKPRLWRLKKSRGIVVYYGLKNDGCSAIHKRLRSKKYTLPVGISIAKTNDMHTVSTTSAIADYVKAYTTMSKIGDYDTINISCPNAYGGQPFSDPIKLNKLLLAITRVQSQKPIYIKLPPDLTHTEIDVILLVVKKYTVAGFVCSNLTKDRKNKSLRIYDKNIPNHGGISGKVVEELSNQQIKYIYTKTKGKYTIIGCGGVFSAQDAYTKIKYGASLIQLITGMIFEGPQLIGEINKGLVELLYNDGFTHISQAVGKDVL